MLPSLRHCSTWHKSNITKASVTYPQYCQRDLRWPECWSSWSCSDDLVVVWKQHPDAVKFVNGVVHLREDETIHLKLNFNVDVHVLLQLQLLTATAATPASMWLDYICRKANSHYTKSSPPPSNIHSRHKPVLAGLCSVVSLLRMFHNGTWQMADKLQRFSWIGCR